MTHGWAGTRTTRRERRLERRTSATPASAPLRKAGFNVLTWDSRGFGESGGVVTVDYKDNEGRDAVALIDWLAKQPEAQLDKAGDPRVGMHGVSYAGGIECVTAAIDKRVDAIAPAISWHSLLTALYREDTAKTRLELGALRRRPARRERAGRRARPAHHLRFTSGLATGRLSAEDRAWFESRGPGDALVEPGARADADAPGHGRHAVHAQRVDAQRGDPAQERRPAQADLVLRRPRDVPDRRRARPGGSRRRPSPGCAATWPASARSTPARASSGSPTTRSGARRPPSRRRPARR